MSLNTLDIPMKEINECPRCLFNKKNFPNLIIYSNSCSVCKEYDSNKLLFDLKYNKQEIQLQELLDKIKRKKSKSAKYDCVIGLSGGVDSSYVALKLKDLGLNPLAVHLDNGWNTNEAVTNITNIVEKLGIDLFTYVIDWEEFRELQKAYFRASVIDIEMLTDHAILSILYNVASKHNIKIVLDGNNFETESILPYEWFCFKSDYVNILDIISKNSKIKIKSYPLLTWTTRNYYKRVKRIKFFSFLNYIKYNKNEAVRELEDRLNYIKYPQKHFESVFTRFYQGYILPTKFGVDKRVAHLSSLVLSGAITREEGLKLIANNEYNEECIKSDYEYVRKKLGFSEEEFKSYFQKPNQSHSSYKVEKSIKTILNPFR